MTLSLNTGRTVIVLPNSGGLQAALKLRDKINGEIHGREGRVESTYIHQYFNSTPAHLQSLFAEGCAILFMGAAGIAIRALAGLLGDKWSEPPVLAISADGASVVPLLGGHKGANDLARDCAAILAGHAAITTATDVAGRPALDAPPDGWQISNGALAQPLMAAWAEGKSLKLSDEPGVADWLEKDQPYWSDSAAQTVLVTHKETSGFALHPPVLALGVGCARGADPAKLESFVRTELAQAGLSPKAVACVVSIDVKADEAAVRALARSLQVPARFFDAATLEKETPRLENPSDVVFAEVGCHGVAEGAALAAAGASGRLILPKRKDTDVTCAVALSDQPIDPFATGRGCGKLTVVGVGPGKASWRTPAVSAAVAEASDLVGYGLYLDLLGPLTNGKALHARELGEETDRARLALDLAAGLHGDGENTAPRNVALVCSGDAGIFALATLVFELLETEGKEVWRDVEIIVEPGVSALQAAASRIGAPLGHDFCAVSLSDLLTPRETIEKRLHAVADGDFVVAFYNPVSKRRKEWLARARDILLTKRPGDTPVILARSLGRPEENVQVKKLADLQTEDADMLTLVMVGASTSRVVNHIGSPRVYTPRGYAGQRHGEARLDIAPSTEPGEV